MAEFVGNVDKNEIVKRLLSAYADEWIAAYRPPRRPGFPLGRVIGSPHRSGFHPSFGGRSGRPDFPPCRKPGGDPPGNNP